jgi:FAD/FMN-containing dehydrogenase
VLADTVVLKPVADTLEEGFAPPPGIQIVNRSAFVAKESVPDVLAILAEVGAAERSPILAVRSLGGAVARVADDATAYAHRQAELMVLVTVVAPAPIAEAARPGLDAIWARLAPHVSGAYANFLASATEEDVAAVYPSETYDRLAAIKSQYDPGNLFRRNHNVLPA